MNLELSGIIISRDIEVNGVTFSFGLNYMEASVEQQRIISRLRDYNYRVHSDNLGHVSLAFNNLIEAELMLLGRVLEY
ncbi:MAG: hypothetical protein ABJN62_11340 [Halioglobus sp.]